jgi:hypothetical protein
MSQGDEKDEIRICVSGPDGSDDSLHSSCEERLKPVVEHDSSGKSVFTAGKCHWLQIEHQPMTAVQRRD